MLQKARSRKGSKQTISRLNTNTLSPLSSGSKYLKKKSNRNVLILCIVLAFIVTACFMLFSLPKNNAENNKMSMTKANIPLSKYIGGRDTIYVSVATLGDYACPQTINDLYIKAKYPKNIFVGIYQQNANDDPDCLSMLEICNTNDQNQQNIIHPDLGDISILCSVKDNIIINRTTIKDGAKGPVYGRHMSMKLINTPSEPTFICMIDSHTLFRKEWDEFTMKMWYSIEPDHEKAVITHYPWGAEHLQKRIDEKNEYSYHICGSIYEGGPNFMVRNANGCFAKNAIKPVRVPFFAGGFSFATMKFWNDVPLDPYLLYIFNGEEFDIASRGWTHGYDFYSPNEDIVGHYYGNGPKRRSPHVGSNQESYGLRDKSEKRLNYMWGLWEVRYPNDKGMSREEIGKKAELRELDKYGLGNKRALKDFWKFVGIDPVLKNITVFKEALWAKGGLEYIKY